MKLLIGYKLVNLTSTTVSVGRQRDLLPLCRSWKERIKLFSQTRVSFCLLASAVELAEGPLVVGERCRGSAGGVGFTRQ